MSTDESSFSSIPGVKVIQQALADISTSPGVYRMYGKDGKVLYVGKAKHLSNRVRSYTHIDRLPIRLQRMVAATNRMDVTLCRSEAEALLLEANIIKTLQPRYNILLKDDKSYPYIQFSGDHAYPRIMKYRGAKTKEGMTFGPYVSAGAVNKTIMLLQKALLLRPCSDNVFKNRSRPCLQYQIKRCSAPCVGYISEEEYAESVQQAVAVLSGKAGEVRRQLTERMEQASEQMEYETAANLRDRIKALTLIQKQTQASVRGLDDADMFAMYRHRNGCCIQVYSFRSGSNLGNQPFFPVHVEDTDDAEVMLAFIGQYYQQHIPPAEILVSHVPEDNDTLEEALASVVGRKMKISKPRQGGKKELLTQAMSNATDSLMRKLNANLREESFLKEVARIFSLETVPQRIEVYDNSHISGTHAVGGMIVAGREGLIKKAYRQFNIKNEELSPGDDFGMMREVLTRRFKRLLAEEGEAGNAPDLVLIDGGAGQLSAATEIMAELGLEQIPIVAIAKGKDRNAGREWFHRPGHPPFQLEKNDPALHYLQRLRDEAHRFAIGTHRARRSKSAKISELDAIAGVGPTRKKALLNYFGSVRGVSAASRSELQKVQGVSREMADIIYNHFHSG